ncbi:hypothetical protein Hanom_Chr07g00649781 [Helianthus anomalus]
MWITFPAALFQKGFTYPFLVLTQGFFTLTGLCYIQAMPMVWRVLYTLEHIVEHEVSHGSHRFLFKSKPQQPPPILKTTKNDTNWRNQFFFVRRDSIPNGSHLPKKWNIDAITLSHIQESPVTKERIEAFWKLDPAIRTFPPRSKDPEEIPSTSHTMSSASKSSMSASRFSVADLQDIVSPRSIKKELAASQSNPEPKGMSTRGKGAKRKKLSESSKGLPLMECQLHDYVSEIALAKDKKISSLEKDINTLQKEFLLAEITTNKERIEIMDGAKLSATIAMLKIKLQMAKEAADPSFDRSEWDLQAWVKRMAELGDEDEPKERRCQLHKWAMMDNSRRGRSPFLWFGSLFYGYGVLNNVGL